ncbi:Ras-specific guanine nucleotide-releasing factor RalGPS1 [Liparis tanakae]|uniref:Ras-specific guanine nucleotide-releasing factor RalGPS1 n=1 Tax=Liparis tanakae TaxID=230148 RepID=A0A4Z2H3X4_9TELE|nr:Ras-specific guanine nucleotide-releasing factor RalGPS1 [Liparis tanakae]
MEPHATSSGDAVVWRVEAERHLGAPPGSVTWERHLGPSPGSVTCIPGLSLNLEEEEIERGGRRADDIAAHRSPSPSCRAVCDPDAPSVVGHENFVFLRQPPEEDVNNRLTSPPALCASDTRDRCGGDTDQSEPWGLNTKQGRAGFAEDDDWSGALKLDGVGMMDLPNGRSGSIITTTAATLSEKSSSAESLSDKGSSDLKKSFDAVVFDVLKVTPEEYAVSEV